MEPLLEETAVDSVPLTKPKKILSAKQIESMRAGREILKQKREEAKARKVLEANEILSKYSKSIPDEKKEEKEIKLEPVKIQIDEPKPKKAKPPPLKIPEVESDSDSEPEQQIVMIKKKKKPKAPKIIYKYISDSSDSDTPPPMKKTIEKPARAVANQKQIRQPAPSIFCD
jgi:hypothetical protein